MWTSHWLPILANYSQWLSGFTLLTGLAVAWRHLECHQTGCHRLGRFSHGHYRLCHVHHPLVPSDGKVTAEHIAAIQPPKRSTK